MSKVMMGVKEGIVSKLEIKKDGETSEFVIPFKYLENSSNKVEDQ